jgi:hypothetical protein
MVRIERVLFRRDHDRDREDPQTPLEGYQLLWADGQPAAVGIEAFCTVGQRLLGLGRYLAGRREAAVELLCFPLSHREANFTRLPGTRIRRFCLRRTGRVGRIHFIDGTPTTIVFDLDRDEPRALAWIGLAALADGQEAWFDIGARSADAAPPCPTAGFETAYPASVN